MEDTIATGFDRNIDYTPTKDKLIANYKALSDKLKNLDNFDKFYVRKKNLVLANIIYTLIAMIQLRNGSRISEACNSFIIFCKKGMDKDVVVKIAKSEAIKYKKGKKFTTKARYRKLTFPKWIEISKELFSDIAARLEKIPADKLRKRVLDYMLRKFDCNTHSLRYACINYLIYDKKTELNTVAKLVGHSNLNMLLIYTQQKNIDKLLDMDM